MTANSQYPPQRERHHIDDICIGDKFRDEYDDIFVVKKFQGSGHVFLECNTCNTDERDTYAHRNTELLHKLNNFIK